MYFDPLYLVISLPAVLFALYAQMKLKSTYSKYSQIGSRAGVTGAETAAYILDHAGISDVRIEPVNGFLSDHYDPSSKTLRLSPDVYSGRSIASLGVAAHEVGHAIQHAEGYSMLQLRSALVPATNIGSMLAWPLIMFGAMLQAFGLVYLGIFAFSMLVLFQLVTLPVEYDASRRAKVILSQTKLFGLEDEQSGVNSVLSAAALTYVAATISAALQLVYFLVRFGVIGGRDR